MRQINDAEKTNLMCAMNKIRLSTCKYDPGNRGNSLAEVTYAEMEFKLKLNSGLISVGADCVSGD